MTDSIQPLLSLHKRFCELAGIDGNDLRFHKAWSRFYWDFHNEGFTEEEMCLVVRYVQSQNKKLEFKRKILPQMILGDLSRFCNDLAEAKRLQALRVGPRQQAVAEFRRMHELPDCRNVATSVKDILKNLSA